MGLGFTADKTPLFVGLCRLLSVLLRPASFLAIATTSGLAFLGLRPCGQSSMELAAAIFVDDLDLTWRALARFGIAAPADMLRNRALRLSMLAISVMHRNSRCGLVEGAAITHTFNRPEPSTATNAVAWPAAPTCRAAWQIAVRAECRSEYGSHLA